MATARGPKSGCRAAEWNGGRKTPPKTAQKIRLKKKNLNPEGKKGEKGNQDGTERNPTARQ